ncbi:hypothetical protein Mal48_42160 [Thalassoglobus polymorphus]|uniref:Uncharacterized protein n=1 Tax=Thalassoglobus polymorphus TaxID=2527994 RepID=A0A517QTI3_9PLAN|nr:hypothetical protein Mal48_42160 [Thalassoglobus polymorphus]
MQVNKPLESGESEVSQGILRSDFGLPVFYDWFIQVQQVAAVGLEHLSNWCTGSASWRTAILLMERVLHGHTAEQTALITPVLPRSEEAIRRQAGVFTIHH